jgi:hypothetical protein
MMTLNQGARMSNKEQQEPHVGIFWLVKGKLIIDATPVSKAEPYGDHVGHPPAISITGRSFREKAWCRQNLNTKNHPVGGSAMTSGRSDFGFVPTAAS